MLCCRAASPNRRTIYGCGPFHPKFVLTAVEPSGPAKTVTQLSGDPPSPLAPPEGTPEQPAQKRHVSVGAENPQDW